MLNISELTDQYIKTNYIEELKKTIYYSFMLQEMFSVAYYEDKYIDLISKVNTIDNDEKRDLFVQYLSNDMNDIIDKHYIKLNEEMDIKLFERNELVHFLYIIQNLEDYNEFGYIVNSDLVPKTVLCNLITKYSLLVKPRAMEIIGEVDVKFITALKEYIKEKESLSSKKIDKEFTSNAKMFLDFTSGSTSLGARLYNEGYNNLQLTELADIVNFNLYEYIDKNITTEPTQTYLDVLSLLVLTKDNYALPLLKFKQNSSIFTSKLENVTKINNGMLAMLSDFNSYVDSKKESSKHVN